MVASSTGVAYFCTELSDSPSLLRKLTAALSSVFSTASLPDACSCDSASTSPVLQFTAFRPITNWLPNPAIEPVSMALPPVRRQTSRVNLRRHTGHRRARPISFKVSFTLRSEIRSEKGATAQAVPRVLASACRRKARRPCVVAKSERMMVSLSVRSLF